MAPNISNVNVITSAKDAGAISLMQRLQNESRQTAEAVNRINEKMSQMGTGGGGGGLTGALTPVIDVAGLAQSAISFVSEQVQKLVESMSQVEQRADLAEVLGFTYEQMQALNLAATLANTNVDALSGAFGRFLKTISEAADGSKSAIDDMGRLGITLEQIRGRSAYEILGVVADRLAAIESPSDRARAAMELFGREAGIKMIQVLDGGAKSLDNYTTKARELGLVLNEAEIASVKFANRQRDIEKLRTSSQTERAAAAAAQEISQFDELGKKIKDAAFALEEYRQKAIDATGAFIAASGFANDEEGRAIKGINAYEDALKGIRSRRGIGNMDSGATPPPLLDSFVGPTISEDILKIRRNAESDLKQWESEQQDKKIQKDRDMVLSYFQWLAEQSKKQRDLELKYARDVADYNRRMDAIDAQNEQNRIDAASRARSDVASAFDNKPELIMSGSAESQRLAFEAKNSKAREQAMQLAEQQRATVILKEIEANQRRSSVISLGGI